MKYFLSILILVAAAQAQDFVSPTALPDAPSTPTARFWTLEKKIDVGILAGLVAADAITTQKGLSQGMRESNPIMRPLVTQGAGGQAAASAIGFGAGVGVVYLLHHTHHYKAERITMRLLVAGEGLVVANNIAALH
jgi:hypothetical protein